MSRHSSRASVPSLRCISAVEVAQSGRQLSHAEALAVARVGRVPAICAEAMRSAEAEEWQRECEWMMTWEMPVVGFPERSQTC